MSKRSEKVADAIHRELAELFRAGVRDPRLHGLTVTAIDIVPDLSHAKVFVSHVEGRSVWPGCEKALGKASGFFRSKIAAVLNTYTVPQLTFVYDDSIARGVSLTSLIDKALAEDRLHPQDEPQDESQEEPAQPSAPSAAQ
jgi:ribosome-binding factor A